MKRTNKELMAVVGANGAAGGAVERALQAGGQFEVRALSRNPGKHRELADEVVRADLNRPETVQAAFEGARLATQEQKCEITLLLQRMQMQSLGSTGKRLEDGHQFGGA
jgi:putative NADH-flavin reductase